MDTTSAHWAATILREAPHGAPTYRSRPNSNLGKPNGGGRSPLPHAFFWGSSMHGPLYEMPVAAHGFTNDSRESP